MIPLSVSQIEGATLTAWPALKIAHDGLWLWRYARGYTKRANSIHCLDPSDGDYAEFRLNRLAALSDEERHQVRIDAKKLRYAAEGFQGLYGRKAADRFIKTLKALQDELGALNDIVTAETLMSRLGLTSEAAFAAGEVVGRKAADKQRHIKAAAKALDRLEAVQPFWR